MSRTTFGVDHRRVRRRPPLLFVDIATMRVRPVDAAIVAVRPA